MRTVFAVVPVPVIMMVSLRHASRALSFHAPAVNRRGAVFLARRSLASPTIALKASSAALDFSQHTLNLAEALKKPVEGYSLSELVSEDVSVLQGIGPVHLEALNALGIQTVHDLAKYKYYHVARSIVVLADTEGERVPHTTDMNINNILDKAYQTKSFNEISDAPVAALFGLSEEKGLLLQHNFGCKTVRDLASMKYCQWAEAMVQLEPFEASTEED